MAVGADHEVPRQDEALFGKERVLNAHAPNLEVVAEAVLFRELSHQFALLRRLYVLLRREVVGHEGHPFAVEDVPGADLFELGYRYGCSNVVCQQEVHLCVYEFSGHHLLLARVGRQDLFGDVHRYPLFMFFSPRAC